jgi:thiol-disulfide isomerase/thioredoxin
MRKASKDECIKMINTETNVLIKVTADWCGPCKKMDDTLKQISEKYNHVNFLTVDVEDAHETVSSLPTLFFYKKGKKVESKSGSMSGSSIEQMIKDCF